MPDLDTLVSRLHPAFIPIVTAILAEAQQALDADPSHVGDFVRGVVGWRSSEDQMKARAAGLSSVNLGWHQYGLALDFGIFDAAGAKYVTDGADPRYRLVGEIAKKHGAVYGGDWKDPDWDHFEWHPGFTLIQYIAFLRTNLEVRT